MNTRNKEKRRPSKTAKAKAATKKHVVMKPGTPKEHVPQLIEPSPAPFAAKPPVVNPYAAPHSEVASFRPPNVFHCDDCGLEIFSKEEHSCPRTRNGGKVADIPPPPVGQLTEIQEIQAANKEILKAECSSVDTMKFLESTTHSKAHDNRRDKMLKTFFQTIVNNLNLGALAHMVKAPNGLLVPRVVLAVAGEKPGMDKIRLVSNLLWSLAVSLRNEKAKEGEMPYLQPSSQNTYMKTLMGVMQQEFDWNFSLSQDFRFTGGYFARIKDLYQQRKEEYPNSYGMGGGRQIPNGRIESVQDLQLSLHFNEDDITDHQKKCFIVCGCFLGLRGRSEHSSLYRDNIVTGQFEEGSDFYGYEYIAITNMEDKTHKLGHLNDRCRNTTNMMRLPIIDMDDLDDPGAILKRYVDKVHPTQSRLYCKPATDTQKANFLMLGEEIHMSPLQPIGENTIAKMIKEAGTKTGLFTSGHGFRRLFITTLVNAEGVSVEEALGSSRHSSVAAQRAYMHRNHRSEANKFAALGITAKKKSA